MSRAHEYAQRASAGNLERKTLLDKIKEWFK